MKPYYAEDGITIYHGDCREVLPFVNAELILTSPPYNVGLQYLGYEDDVPEDDFRSFNAEWMARAFGSCRDGSRLYVIVGDKMLWWFKERAEQCGWTYHQMLAWCKPNLAGRGTGKISGDWNHLAEWILLFRKGKRTPMLDGGMEGANTHSFFVIPSPQTNWNQEQKEHPAQWPIELAMRILARTPGEIVLDPFMGSGTTLRAAKDLGRRAIGIEIEEKYCEIAAKRLAQKVFEFEPL